MKHLYTFPDEQTIYDALRAVDDTGGDVERCQRHIAQSLAGKTLVPPVANLAWEMSVTMIAQRGLPGLAWIMDTLFDDSMAAIITDDVFLSDVLQVRNDVRDDFAKAMRAAMNTWPAQKPTDAQS